MHCDSRQRNWTVSWCPWCRCALEKGLFSCLHQDTKSQQPSEHKPEPCAGGRRHDLLQRMVWKSNVCLGESRNTLLEVEQSFLPSWILLPWAIRGGNSFQADNVYVTAHLEPVRWTASSPRSPRSGECHLSLQTDWPPIATFGWIVGSSFKIKSRDRRRSQYSHKLRGKVLRGMWTSKFILMGG